eukprot:TRINITY_DN6256_c0_g1_i27.p1 TRINITY_DN6256_c0_g1~~TRINITY_DN6256_c0_g1_i27.p1  ORF type:complete len:354 (-),score=46.96 TRINITY_DN6256_c0_g1_i27:31-1092(-)
MVREFLFLPIIGSSGINAEYGNCPISGSLCEPFVLYQDSAIEFEEYRIRIRILFKEHSSSLVGLGDVILRLSKDNASFSILALIIHFIYLMVTILVIVYHLYRLKSEKLPFIYWSTEQRLLMALVISLLCLNNPFYPLEFLIPGWGASFFNNFLELIFTLVLFSFWFITLHLLQTDGDVIEWNPTLVVQLILVGLYGFSTSILYAWSSFREQYSPLFGLNSRLIGINIIFYISSGLMVVVGMSFCVILVLTLAITNKDRPDKRVRFYFFTIPTLITIMSVLVGLFAGTLGPFGRDTPSFVYFISLYNIYTYILIWGFWPIDSGIKVLGNPTEGTRIFSDAHDFDTRGRSNTAN